MTSWCIQRTSSNLNIVFMFPLSQTLRVAHCGRGDHNCQEEIQHFKLLCYPTTISVFQGGYGIDLICSCDFFNFSYDSHKLLYLFWKIRRPGNAKKQITKTMSNVHIPISTLTLSHDSWQDNLHSLSIKKTLARIAISILQVTII